MIRTIGLGRGAVALFSVAAVLLPGCAPGDNLPECAPVTGKVTMGGEPIVGAMVTFHPEKPGNTGQAASEADGTYTLNTYGTQDGALVGKHTVTIERYLPPMPTQPGGKLPSSKSAIPAKY